MPESLLLPFIFDFERPEGVEGEGPSLAELMQSEPGELAVAGSYVAEPTSGGRAGASKAFMIEAPATAGASSCPLGSAGPPVSRDGEPLAGRSIRCCGAFTTRATDWSCGTPIATC